MFYVPKDPWWGGVFKSTKRYLRKIVGQAKFSYNELSTAIVEVDMVVNSRPLSYLEAPDGCLLQMVLPMIPMRSSM